VARIELLQLVPAKMLTNARDVSQLPIVTAVLSSVNQLGAISTPALLPSQVVAKPEGLDFCPTSIAIDRANAPSQNIS
jgi:hypothetical protein